MINIRTPAPSQPNAKLSAVVAILSSLQKDNKIQCANPSMIRSGPIIKIIAVMSKKSNIQE